MNERRLDERGLFRASRMFERAGPLAGDRMDHVRARDRPAKLGAGHKRGRQESIDRRAERSPAYGDEPVGDPVVPNLDRAPARGVDVPRDPRTLPRGPKPDERDLVMAIVERFCERACLRFRPTDRRQQLLRDDDPHGREAMRAL